ncbi:hypothetical protein HPP92_016044 [Vanilla planifolia]|uniref:rRNA adenine N(6)-methyltransferase n=1 Tax=Vanilla planifolia TaxID=51239 RepID=A0A835UU87_VANPL|nr:hypothetical protein HPP92_016044 [Vanilla planifolia]
MAKIVEDRFGSTEKLMVLVEDITRCHVGSHVRSFLGKWNPGKVTKCAKVVSNIPFNISTDVVKLLLPMGDLFSDVVLLLQDETALRLVELQLRSPEYRPINLFVSFYSDAEYMFKVGRENFFPKPKANIPMDSNNKLKARGNVAQVDAAVVKFKLKQNSEYPQVSSRKGFFSMVKSAFNGKRKMLRKSLQHICSAQEIEDALKTISLPVTARPQELSLEDFVRLYNIISKSCQIFPEPEHLNL